MIEVHLTAVYVTVAIAWVLIWFRLPRALRPRGAARLAYVLLGVNTLAVIAVAFTPFVWSASERHYRINLHPVVETYLMLKYGYLDIALYNVLGNLFLLVPFALLAPVLFGNTRGYGGLIASVFVFSLSIETLQLIYGVRIFDVDDIILNVLGAVLAFSGARALARRTGEPWSGWYGLSPAAGRSLSLSVTHILLFAAGVAVMIGVSFLVAIVRA